jgi:hypothetical protein
MVPPRGHFSGAPTRPVCCLEKADCEAGGADRRGALCMLHGINGSLERLLGYQGYQSSRNGRHVCAYACIRSNAATTSFLPSSVLRYGYDAGRSTRRAFARARFAAHASCPLPSHPTRRRQEAKGCRARFRGARALRQFPQPRRAAKSASRLRMTRRANAISQACGDMPSYAEFTWATFKWWPGSVPVQTRTTVNVRPRQPSSGPPSAHLPSVTLLLDGQTVVLLNAIWIE